MNRQWNVALEPEDDAYRRAGSLPRAVLVGPRGRVRLPGQQVALLTALLGAEDRMSVDALYDILYEGRSDPASPAIVPTLICHLRCALMEVGADMTIDTKYRGGYGVCARGETVPEIA